MTVKQPVRIGGVSLSVQVLELPPFLVGQWVGIGRDTAREAAVEAAGELLARPGERLVLDFRRFQDVSDSVVQVLARMISEAQRVGREVLLVRCPDDLFRRLQRGGMTGAITHAASLLAATQGLTGEPMTTLDLHLRSSPDILRRLRSVVHAVAGQARLSDAVELDLKMAVTEAAANAIVHGSPEGTRNHVRVSFHVEPEAVIVDVADQGPGFEPTARPAGAELREDGYGLCMMEQLMDRLEFYKDDRGMLVRMTKFLNPRRGEWLQ